MQWPPTPIPGVCLWKFHLDEAAERTSSASSPSLGRRMASSFTNAKSISLCAFSTSFDASATSMELTGITSPDVIFPYNFDRILVSSSCSDPLLSEHPRPHSRLLGAYPFWTMAINTLSLDSGAYLMTV